MKPTRVIVIMVIIGLVQTAPLANALTISCQTLNAGTHLPQIAFNPGDKVLLEVTPGFPETLTVHQQILLTTHATATIAGFTMPFTLSASSIDPGTRPTGGPLFQHGTEKLVFRIPKKCPPGSITVTIRVSIQNVGTASCSGTITIL
jgi:hypothetical protein